MSTEPIYCKKCGGELELVNSEKEIYKCRYCGLSYVVKDDIIYNYTYNTTKIEHLQTEKVVLEDDKSVRTLINAGDAFIKLGDYAAAERKFEEVVRDYPGHYEGWWGLTRIKTNDFKDTLLAADEYKEILELYHKASTFCEDKSVIEPSFSDYEKRVMSAAKQKCMKIEKEIQEEEYKKDSSERENTHIIEHLDQEINDLNESIKKLNGEKKVLRTPKERDQIKTMYIVIVLVEILAIINAFNEHHLFSGFVSALLPFLVWIPGMILWLLFELVIEAIVNSNYKAMELYNKNKDSAINDCRNKITSLESEKDKLKSVSFNSQYRIHKLEGELKKYSYCKE